MTLHEEYEERLAALRRARSQMLSDRLTRSRKEAQMHEADVEQDDSVAEYFAGRTAEMTRRVTDDEVRMVTLAAEAEGVRIAMVTEDLDKLVASYNDALNALAAQLAMLDTAVEQIATLSRHAEELATTLPASAARQHQAADAVTTRTNEIGERVQALRDAVLASIPPPNP
ncbi:MAG: hypothetical protein M3Z19_12970 [Chloroflexota bacterium]|nr:hypothetical protein [Chloroflexota bacterium]